MRFASRSTASTIFILALVLVLVTTAIISNTGGTMQMQPSNKRDNEAIRAAALSLLESMNTNRNATIDPDEWGPPLRMRGFRPLATPPNSDLTFSDKLVPDSELSLNERLLIYGYPAKADPAVYIYRTHYA
jgi:hypothetical protein